MKRKNVDSVDLVSMFVIGLVIAAVAGGSIKVVNAMDLKTQVAITASASNNTQAAAYGGAGSVTRAGIPSGNLMIPGATTTTPVVEKTPVYKLTNFPEMRRGLEKLFDSFVTGTSGSGPLYTSQVYKYGTSLVDVETNLPTFSGFLGTKYSQQYLAKQGMSQELANLAKYSFKDVKGTEWYASLIPLSVYYGIVNGYEDGTFRGTQPVTRAELAVILTNYSNSSSNSTSFKSIYGDAWYAGSLDALDASPLTPDALNKTTITQGATRGEVAKILANTYAPEAYSRYHAAIKAGTIKNYIFKDVKGFVSSLDKDYDDFTIKNISGYYPAYQNKMKNPSKPPSDVLAAMLALNEVNVMQGDSAGNSNWTKTVTRAEVLAFLQKGEMMSSLLTR